jgi:hypothetical protein
VGVGARETSDVSQPLRYPWPRELNAWVEIPAPDSRVRLTVQNAASKAARRYSYVYRTRWDGQVVRVRRAA